MAQGDINTASGGGESVLDRLWTFGQATVDRGLTYILEKDQMERMIKLRKAEAQADIAKKESYTYLGSAMDTLGAGAGNKMVPYVLAAALGLAAFVVVKKK